MLLTRCFFICIQLSISGFVRIQLGVVGDFRSRRRTVEVLHVHIFFDRFPVKTGHRCDLRDVHALLVEQFSGRLLLECHFHECSSFLEACRLDLATFSKMKRQFSTFGFCPLSPISFYNKHKRPASMVRSVTRDLPEQVKNNQAVNKAAGSSGQK